MTSQLGSRGRHHKKNREGIEKIINEAMDWERRSGATFEAEKTAISHFTRKQYKTDTEPFTIKGLEVKPQECVKVLGVVMDTKLKYREHMARAGSKGLEAVLELRRLKGLSPPTARQLFTSTVAPVMDYASSFWMHECHYRAASPIQRVQRIGAQAIVGSFMSVATSVAEAEAHISSAQERFWRKAIKMWTDIPRLYRESTPCGGTRVEYVNSGGITDHHSTRLRDMLKVVAMEHLEAINPFTLAPWE